jgi:uncharacterized membrane protein
MVKKHRGEPVGETHLRSIVKAVSWRVLATFTTIILVLIFTGELVLAMGIGFLEVLSKMILYFLHERMWNMVRWGRGV